MSWITIGPPRPFIWTKLFQVECLLGRISAISLPLRSDHAISGCNVYAVARYQKFLPFTGEIGGELATRDSIY